eukprot:XP_001697719.1 predicted protein [Chlamydomonas reinhardtii]
MLTAPDGAGAEGGQGINWLPEKGRRLPAAAGEPTDPACTNGLFDPLAAPEGRSPVGAAAEAAGGAGGAAAAERTVVGAAGRRQAELRGEAS